MLTPAEITALVRSALPDAIVEVVDTKGTGDHFEARVVSAAFEGRSMVEQHRLVYSPLGEKLGSGVLHALALETYTPAQWAKKRGETP